jgi:hypothetical protein
MKKAVATLAIVCMSLIIIGLMLASISDAKIDPKTIILKWSLDGDVKDSSDSKNNGTINGDPKFVTGILGKALEFDGKDDYVLSPALPIYMGKPFTVSLWIKPADPVTGTYIHISSQADGGGWCTPLIGTHTGDKPAFLTYNMLPGVVSETVLAPKEWAFLAGVHTTGPESLIYVYVKNKMSVASLKGSVSDSGGTKYLSVAKISGC